MLSGDKDERIELDDLVYAYPSVDMPGFQTAITRKKEFRDVAATVREPVPVRGQLFKQQKFLRRFMTQYDKSFVIWETGTGKTCGVLGVTEYFKNIPNSNIRHVYILVKGPSLVNEFKHQLICKCTAGEYETDAIQNAPNEMSRKRNITLEIKKFYTITTYGKFAKEVGAMKSDQMLIDKYSGCIFIIDEVHNLRIDASTGNIMELKEIAAKKKNSKIRDQVYTYLQIHRLFHLVKRSKIMILSATPMINQASEIAALMNLLLPLDRQMPLDGKYYKNATLEQLEPYFRGLITYVRSLDTGARIEYVGSPLDRTINIDNKSVKTKTIIYRSAMSNYQEQIYKIAEKEPLRFLPENIRKKSVKPEAFSRLLEQAANFVFPNGKTGTYGFRDYIYKSGANRYNANTELNKYLSNMNSLKTLSSKFYQIVKLCTDNPGNCWCYSDLLSGSGGILLSLCFKAQGFEEFTEKRSIFLASNNKGGLKPYCEPNAGDRDGREINLKLGVKRYAILTSENQAQHHTILEAFNSYENRHGDIIKVVIGSPVTQIGLNLANVLQIHLVGPSWNISSSKQAQARAIRSTSHVDLIQEEKNRLISIGEDPSSAYVTVKIYRHAAVTSGGNSIDIHKYIESEIKNVKIKRIFRMMKQSAVDCQLNYQRNVRETDIDGSERCDYTICKYQCFGENPQTIDTSSFNVLYSKDMIENASSDIKEILKYKFTTTFSELYSMLDKYQPQFIDLAIEHLITNKDYINNRFGYKSYIQEDGNNIYLQRDFPVSDIDNKYKYSQSYYTKTLIGNTETSLEQIVSSLNLQEEKSAMLHIWDLNAKVPKFKEKLNNILDNLSLENQVHILETATYAAFVQQKDSDVIRAVINKYRLFLYTLIEPTDIIKQTAESLSKRGMGRGRPPKSPAKAKLKTSTQEAIFKDIQNLQLQPQDKETIYIHNLYTKKMGKTSYNIGAKFRKTDGRVRILKPSEGYWRDAIQYELPVYNAFINSQKESIIKKYEKFVIFGTILEDNSFRIHDLRPQTKTTKTKTTDRRTKKRGRVCSSWDKTSLLDILWELKINPFKSKINLPRKQLLQYINIDELEKAGQDIQTFSDEKIKFYYQWYRSGLNIKQMCNELKNAMIQQNRVLII